jgi:elongator complex protein 2
VHATLPGHLGQVTTLKLLSDSPGSTTFVSGDSVGEVRIWREGPIGYTCVLTFRAHPGHSVSALAVSPATPTQGGGALNNHVFTGGSDGAVKLWRIEGKKAGEVQRMDLRGKLPLDMEVAYLPGSQGESSASPHTAILR